MGVTNLDSCILSIKVYNTLLSIKEELIFAESLVNIKQNDERIFIAFNDNVEPFVNKSELIDYLNYTYTKQFVQTSDLETLESLEARLKELQKAADNTTESSSADTTTDGETTTSGTTESSVTE